MQNRKLIVLGLIVIGVSVALIMQRSPNKSEVIGETESKPAWRDELTELASISRRICTETEGMVVRIDARRDRLGNGDEFQSFFLANRSRCLILRAREPASPTAW